MSSLGSHQVGLEQPLGQVQHQRGGAQIAGVHQFQVQALADDSFIPRLRRAHQIGGEVQPGIRGEVGGQVFLGRVFPVASDPREPYLEVVTLGTYRPHCTVCRGLPGPTATGRAVKSKGMPSTSAYSTSNLLSSFSS